jgi:glycosyltransferase involved in cell wall biosynthesis
LSQVRVLHIHSGNIFGGIETFLLTQARYQHLCPSLEFEFALCFAGRLRDELRAMGRPVYDLGAVRLRDPLSVRRARRNLEQLLRQDKFDVLVTHSSWTQAVFGPVLRSSSVPLVFYMHAPPDGRHWLERLAKRTKPNLVVCNSEFTAQSSSLLYPNVPAEITFYPVAPSETTSHSRKNAIRDELATSPDSIVVIQVSRMEPWKGHTLHLQALAKLPQSDKWICWMVGGAQRPSERKYVQGLQTLARELGIAERIRFAGQRNDVNNLVAAADIFCQPNIAGEPFGISFIEALYAALPVVTTDIGAAQEIVDETCGVRVPAGDLERLAQEFRGLIENPDLRARLGSGGRARAARLCDPQTQLNKFKRSISSLTHRQQAIA